MASGDFCDMDASNIIDILKMESDTSDDIFMEAEKVRVVSKGSTEGACTSEPPAEQDSFRIVKEEKLGHRRVHSDGGVSFKNINTTMIMDSIQLGVQRSVRGNGNGPDRDVLMADFMTVESTIINTEDAGNNVQLTLKTYAPEAFKHFRHLFGISADHFVSSFCNAPLRELPNPGASGSVLFLTRNDAFIAKTVQRREADFLQKLLPGYYLNLNQNPDTLLPKFFGLYCYKCGSKRVRSVVMNNVLPTSVKIHHRYDLKGSTFNRKASKAEREKLSPTFKDLDFMNHHPEGVFLDAEAHRRLVTAIQRDCRVLESFKIIDYSLLLGIHNLDRARGEEIAPERGGHGPNASGDGSLDDSKSTEIPAPSRALLGIPARQANGERLLLFVGIIDILQSYKLKKRLEHVWKSIVYDGDSVSVHNPRFYSQRFQDFIAKSVFKAMPLSPKIAKRKAFRKRT